MAIEETSENVAIIGDCTLASESFPGLRTDFGRKPGNEANSQSLRLLQVSRARLIINRSRPPDTVFDPQKCVCVSGGGNAVCVYDLCVWDLVCTQQCIQFSSVTEGFKRCCGGLVKALTLKPSFLGHGHRSTN